MIEYLNPVIYIVTSLILIIVIYYAVSNKSQFTAKLLQKQTLDDGTTILTFMANKKSKKSLKIGQQYNIKTKVNQKGRQFTPIQSSADSFKIILIPSLQTGTGDQQEVILKELESLLVNGTVFVKVQNNRVQFLGNSQIRVTTSDNKIHAKKYKNVYILAQGNKVPIAYQIIKGLCQDKSQSKPNVTVLFVGGEISDFALRNEFQHLEDNYDNIKYFYSIPIKGERQPSVAGMGISSEKVAQSFATNVEDTFCILCAEQADLSVTVQRALLNKKVPPAQIYKY